MRRIVCQLCMYIQYVHTNPRPRSVLARLAERKERKGRVIEQAAATAPSQNPDERSSRSPRWLRWLALDAAAPIAAAVAVTLLMVWPLPIYFTTAIIGFGDATWGLGALGYWYGVTLGRDLPYFASLLYYPHGVTFATSALGPVSALFAAPFWALGPAAAYNGALVIGFALTGWCMYLLARDLGCSRPAAYLAGLLLMLAPLHVLAVYGHLHKIFLGAIPLALLVCRRGLRTEERLFWALLVGPTVLVSYMQAPEQYVFAGLGVGILILGRLWQFRSLARADWRRLGWIVVSLAVFMLPVYWLVTQAAGTSGVAANVINQSAQHQVDLLEFFVPADLGILPFRDFVMQLLPGQIIPDLETAAYLSWLGLILCGIALWRAPRQAAIWLIMLLVAMVFALGPALKVAGQNQLPGFEAFMPYSLASNLPGFGYMRTPGRFMFLGYTAFAACAAIGLDQLRRLLTKPVWMALAVLAGGFVLLEAWPATYPRIVLPPTPEFYRQLAADPERYGVFDLPLRPDKLQTYDNWYIQFSTFYQIDQITHGKGIATGYPSRYYSTHPLFAQFLSQDFDTVSPLQEDVTVDGEPSSRYANLRYDLAQNNFRYVVVHKPQPDHPVYKPGMWGEEVTKRLVADVFGDEPPLVDDALVTVYAVGAAPPVDQLQPSIALREPSDAQGWTDSRWALSPSTFTIHSPKAMLTTLEVTPKAIMTPDFGAYFEYATLNVESGGGAVKVEAPIALGQTTSVPLALLPGTQVITLTVTPTADSHEQNQPLTFAIQQVNLTTGGAPDVAVRVEGGAAADGVQAAYGPGWYGAESAGDAAQSWRWAASPATVWVYSSEPRTVTLEGTPAALHVAGSQDGKGNAGVLHIRPDNLDVAIEVGKPFSQALALHAGWNAVTLALEAGNFRPIDLDPSTGDSRPLSFAAQNLVVR